MFIAIAFLIAFAAGLALVAVGRAMGRKSVVVNCSNQVSGKYTRFAHSNDHLGE